MSRLGTQVRTEVTLVSRNGEQLLLTLGIPIMLLVFFSVVDVLPTGTDDPVDFLAPGVLALAVMSTAMVSLGIGTGFERSYHVLKRLGATPLGRGRLIAAKIVSVVASSSSSSPSSCRSRTRSAGGRRAHLAPRRSRRDRRTIAFAGIGLTMAVGCAARSTWRLRTRCTSSAPPRRDGDPVLRAALRTACCRPVLPGGALADVLREALSDAGTRPGESWVVLGAWAVLAPLVARRLFRFDDR
jgi:ABC-2 type transport system permease protein